MVFVLHLQLPCLTPFYSTFTLFYIIFTLFLLQADLNKMQMLKPYMGALRRRYNPGIWFNYRASEHHMSFHAKVQKVQVRTDRDRGTVVSAMDL